MKIFKARWFQDINGKYLSLDQSDRSVIEIKALSLEDAIELAKEKEHEDSEIPFTDRVLVN